MKKLLVIVFLIAMPIITIAQDRTTATQNILSWKSKEITKAIYWKQNKKTGKWESHKNANHVFTNNFKTIFIGEHNGYKYLFLDYWDYDYRYPEIREGKFYYECIYQCLLSEEDMDALMNLTPGDVFSFQTYIWGSSSKGKQINTLKNDFGPNHVWYSTTKESREYSPSNLLSKTESNRHTNVGSPHTPIQLITVKRTLSNGKDVIRFRTYPYGDKYSIDSEYFEISYDYYLRLFTSSKNASFN